jgi:hypothetical protein
VLGDCLKMAIKCPCHDKPMEERGEDYYCSEMGFWEVSELEYLYGKDWKQKLTVS